MTREELDDIAANWYHRIGRLNYISNDQSEPVKRRAKALMLWNEMFKRMQLITQIYIRLNTPKAPQFPLGGTIVGEEKIILDNSEHVIKPR